MANNTEIVDNVLSLICQDDEMGFYVESEMTKLRLSLSIDMKTGKLPADQVAPLTEFLWHIHQDQWNILTLLTRLEWVRKVAEEGELSEGLWWMFSALDIEHFHVEARSVYDYAARAMRLYAAQKGVCPKSFRELQGWLKENPGNARRIGQDFAEIISEAEEFPGIRGLRDAAIHGGAYTLVFGSPRDGINFQMYKGFRAIGGAMPRDCEIGGPLDLCHYAADVVSRMIWFLERVAGVLREKTAVTMYAGSRDFHPGYGTLRDWIVRYRATLT